MNHDFGPFALSRSRNGSALLPALIAVVTVASLSAIALQSSLGTLNEERVAAARKQAFYVAEAGLAEAFASLATGGGGNIGTMEKPAKLGAGFVFVESMEDEWGHFKLTSFGLVQDARVRLGAVVEPEEIHLGELGFFASESLVVGEGSQLLIGGEGQGIEVDDMPAIIPPLKVQSNGSIEIQGTYGEGATTIDGDVVPGPDATLTMGTGVSISGTTTAGSLEIEIPAAQPPTVDPYADILIVANSVRSFGGIDAAASSVTLGSGSTLSLIGPAKIVLGGLALEAGSRLIADGTDGPVELFIEDTFSVGAGASFGNATGDSADFSLAFMSELQKTIPSADDADSEEGKGVDSLFGGRVTSVNAEAVMAPVEYTLRSATPFIGTVIAPEASITLESGTQMMGAIIAHTLILEPGTEAYTDPRLGETGPLLGGGIKLKSWQMLPIPKVLRAGQYDPGMDYEIAAEVPPTMTDAHQKVRVIATFTSSDGETYNTFVESASDLPSGVVTVIETKTPADIAADSSEYKVVGSGASSEIELTRVRAVADNVLTSDRKDWAGRK